MTQTWVLAHVSGKCERVERSAATNYLAAAAIVAFLHTYKDAWKYQSCQGSCLYYAGVSLAYLNQSVSKEEARAY